MKNLLLLLLLSLPISVLAQLSEGNSPEFLSKKSKLEESYQRRVDALAERILGNDSFLASSVDVEFAAPVQTQGEKEFQGQLTYVPNQWEDYFAQNEDSFVLKTLNVSVFLKSDVNSARESMLRSSLEANFSRFNLKLELVRVDALAFSKSAGGEVGRSPASDQAKFSNENVDTLPILEKLALPIVLFLSMLLFTFAMIQAFRMISRGLGDAAQSIAGGMARIGDSDRNLNDSVAASTEHRVDAFGSVDREVEDSVFDRLVVQFEKLIVEKKDLLRQALGELPDASLLHLVEFLPHLDDECIVEFKEALGARVDVFAFFEVKDLPDRFEAVGWMRSLQKKVHALELVGVSEVAKQFSEDELSTIRQLRGQGLYDIFSSVLGAENSKIVKALPELLSKKQLEELFLRSTPDLISRYLNTIESSLDDSSIGNISQVDISKLKSSLSSASVGTNGVAKASAGQMKVIQSILELQQSLTLDEEIQNWNVIFEKSPKLKNLAQQEYWSLEAMAKVPENILNPWITRLDNKLLASLLYFSRKADLGSLWARFEGLLPTGMRKTIIMDYYKRIDQGVTHPELIQWSTVIRQNIENLRIQHKQGRFELLDYGQSGAGDEKAAA